MDSLQDYSPQAQPTLADYQLDPSKVAPVFNQASTSALAAKSAAISSQPDQVAQNYQTVMNETSVNGKSDAANTLIQQAKTNHQAANKSALLPILADPSVPDEVKQAAISKVYDQGSDLYSLDHMVAISALNAPVQNESQEEENVRVDTAGAINEVNGVRMQQQAALNSELAKINPSTTQALGDFVKDLIPFSQRNSIADIRGAVTGDNGVWNTVKSWVAQGSAKQDISDAINNADPQQRMAIVQKAIDMINSHNGIVASDDNQLNNMQYLQQFLTEGGYGSTDKLVDNLTGLLDFAALGGSLKAELKASSDAKAAEAAMDAAGAGKGWEQQWASNAARDNVRSQTQPSTLSQIYKDTNVDKYRNAFDASANASSDEVAQATHGTTRQDAVVGDLAPEVGHTDGTVNAKPSAPDANDIMRYAPDPELTEFVNYDSGNKYFQDEKAQARSNVVNDFQQAYGMTSRGEMFQIQNLDADPQGSMLNIKAVYGPQVSGYSNAQDAIDTAKFALKKYGIGDDQISLIKREGSQYVPATQEDIAKGNGDFLVQVDYNHQLNNTDVTDWIRPSVKFNRLDAASGSGQRGTIVSNLLDAASVQDPVIFNSMSTASYREGGLEKMILTHAKDYSTMRQALGERGLIVDKAILDGNDRGITWNKTELQSMGMKDDQIATYQKHRYIQDQIWHLENRAYAKKLASDGWKMFTDTTNDSQLVARPVAKGSLSLSDRLYEPLTNQWMSPKDADLETLYKNGGTVAELRQPLKMPNGDWATHIISRETQADGYLAGINHQTKVLNYRPGYFRVAYKDPHFIDQVLKDKGGNVIGHKTVATAESRKEAELMMRRLQAAQGGEYRRRYGREIGIDRSSGAHLDQAISQGRSTQRFRGKRLEDSTTNAVQNLASQNIKNHVEVMVDQARSIAHYLTLGDVIETAKARALSVYGDYLPKVNDKPTIPGNAKDIKYYGDGTEDRKMLADAKTSINYINYMQHGYVNSINAGSKAMLWNLADAVGAHSSTAEKAIQKYANGRGPVGTAKAAVFNTMIALNPLRHFALQAHQAIMMAPMNPAWAVSGRGVNQILYMISRQVGLHIDNMPQSMKSYFTFGTGMDEETLRGLGKEFDMTGLAASIDKHALVGGALQDMADELTKGANRNTVAKQVAHIPGAALNFMRKVGFDAGEYINRVSAWLGTRDLYASKGLDPKDPEVAAEIVAKASNYTGNMSAAANMPYNDTELGLVLQFQQYMHKMFLTGLTNRNLSAAEKLKYNAFYYAMFGVGGVIGYNSFFKPVMPDNPTGKAAVVDGLESTLANKALSAMYDKDIHIDFSGIAPYDMYGTLSLLHSMMTTSAGEVIAGTPAGQVLFGGNSKLMKAAKTTARYFHLIDDVKNPVDFGQVALDWAKVSAGLTNGYKAVYLLAYGKKYYSTGKTQSVYGGDVPSPVAVAQAFGMGDLDDATLNDLADKYQFQKDWQEADLRRHYENVRDYLASDNIGPDNVAWAGKVYGEFGRAYAMDQSKYQLLNGWMKADLANGNGNGAIYTTALRDAQVMNTDEVKATMNALSSDKLNDQQKASLSTLLDQIGNWKDSMEKKNKEAK